MRRGRVVAALTVVLVASVSCGNDEVTSPSAETAPPLPGAGESVGVSAIDNTFRPEQVEVQAGTEVVFTNNGRNDHDIIPADQRPGDDLAWGAEADDFVPRDTYRVVFERPGTYDYYCSIHGTSTAGMIGTITVTG